MQWLKLLLMCLPFLPGDGIENAFFDLAPNNFFGQDVVPEQIEFHQYIEQYGFNKVPRELLSVINQQIETKRITKKVMMRGMLT